MNKTALKKFATEARVELLEKVELQARKLGITAESIQKANVESSDAVFIDGKQLSDTERRQRNKLIVRINEIGFNRVMEETAYTWFNRFIALRYMEVNDYLPTKVRVLSSNTGSAEPDMMKEALSLDLDLDKEKVYDLKMNNETDELFKYLIKMHCNDLNRHMPFMFETIEDYTEILFPEGLLGTDSFVRQMTDTEVIPEDNWTKVEIIGWLYQYYISEENERVIKAKKRYKAEELPFATQLFTPEWIVRYMVQNALGRYWVESHPEHRELIENWEFYLENPNPEADFEEKLAPYINKELNVEDIKCFDPAMGSGHILVYMFDVLHEIYSKCGYMEREIPRLIIEKNLYGLDIDDRAYQLASFSVVMKALQYNKRFLRSVERDGLTMNLASIQETNMLSDEEVAFLAGDSSGEQFDKMKSFIDQFKDAKVIGSLVKVESYEVDFLHERLITIEKQDSTDLFELDMKDRTLTLLKSLIKQAMLIDFKYDVFITNPPYAGSRYVTVEVSSYLAKNYPEVKLDLFSAFVEYSFKATRENGQIAFMTPFVWMFISSYEKLRQNIIKNRTISSLIQLEYSGFKEATVPICTFTMRNYHSELTGEYIKLSDFKGADNQPLKTIEAVQNPTISYRYSIMQDKFTKIPGNPIAYWASDGFVSSFENKKFGDFFVSESLNLTGNNEKYLRKFWEVGHENVGIGLKWLLYAKGGGFRKWSGNLIDVVNWSPDAIQHYRTDKVARIIPEHLWYKKGITWGFITSGLPSFRVLPENSTFDIGGASVFFNDYSRYNYYLAILNSKFAKACLELLNPTLNMQMHNIASLPIIEMDKETETHVQSLTENCIAISKNDWDSYETSFEFKKHPLLISEKSSTKIYETYRIWSEFIKEQFLLLKNNEEELNRIILEAYGLEHELSP